jgi:signal transduction histidine kinase
MTDEAPEFMNALILVIDDEDTQRLLTRDCLEEEGFKVEDVSNGKDGLDQIRRLKPDLVLLDLMMPGIDGFEVCRQVRADSETSNIPIIVVTGREDAVGIQQGFDVGASDFLTKPIVWNLFPNRVRYVLRTSRMERELRMAMEAAEVASEAKTNLLATMGHELRTPLNAIIGFSDIMLRASFGPLGSPQYEEYCADINNSGTQLLNVINDILDIVKSESTGDELSLYGVEFGQLVQGVIDALSAEATTGGIEIINEVLPNGFKVRVDERKLSRAVSNLLSNAIKFTDRGGEVRLQMTSVDNDALMLSIIDNGIGISEEDLPRIMEPFEQADSSLSRSFEGLGLGIPLARALIHLHGGKIDVTSELGRGTTVQITLPAVSEDVS